VEPLPVFDGNAGHDFGGNLFNDAMIERGEGPLCFISALWTLIANNLKPEEIEGNLAPSGPILKNF
jgi:hypothetical protein